MSNSGGGSRFGNLGSSVPYEDFILYSLIKRFLIRESRYLRSLCLLFLNYQKMIRRLMYILSMVMRKVLKVSLHLLLREKPLHFYKLTFAYRKCECQKQFLNIFIT